MMGVEPGQLGSPRASTGADLVSTGQVVIDGSLPGADVGDTVTIGGKQFNVVGEISGQSLFAGIPLVYVPLEDAQAIAVLGQPLATTLLFDHIPTFLPKDLKVLTNADVKDDVLRPLTAARSSIGFVRLLLWLVAAIVIGSVLYLQALERSRDFAVFKATGTSTAAIGVGLALQAVMVSMSRKR